MNTNPGALTIAQLITQLEDPRLPQDADVVIALNDGHHNPGDLTSYRGFYEDIAIRPDGTYSPTVAAFAHRLRIKLGTTITGYKGGDYMVEPKTSLWVSMYGDASYDYPTGVEVRDGVVVITTANEYEFEFRG